MSACQVLWTCEMAKGTWHVMTGLLLFWLLILVYMSTSLFQSGDSPEHMEQQLLKALRELDKLRRQNTELQGLSKELKQLRDSIERDNPAVEVLKQKLDDANHKLKRMSLLRSPADQVELERAANVLDPPVKEMPQGESGSTLPSIAFEQLRRQVQNGVVEMWFYLQSQLNILQTKNSDTDVAKDVVKILQNGADHQRTILKDLKNLTTLNGPAGWQAREAEELSDIVQRRLHHLQNPADCSTAKKLVCNINKGCGYGCQLHHVVYCFIVAYGSGRTMVLESKGWTYQRSGWEAVFKPVSDTCTSAVGSSRRAWGSPQVIENIQVVELPIVDGMHPRPDYMPQAIPADLAPRLIRLHGHPFVWWVGQFLKYLLRPQPHLHDVLVATEKRLLFKNPIVGVHVRRTDKVGTEAAFHGIDEYMGHVEDYYRLLQKTQHVDKKRVYLATDDQNLLEEAKQKYPEYVFVGDSEFSRTAGLSSRYTDSSLLGIIMDIHFLSKSNYLVCTFSSQVCRVAYEIMQTLHADASGWFHSLDDIYYYGGQMAHDQITMYTHNPQSSNEILLEPGDRVGIAGNHWNGYSKGTNRRTGMMGLYPSYKVRDDITIVDLPTYPEADKSKKDKRR